MRILKWILTVILLCILAVGITAFVVLKKSAPAYDGTFSLSGLKSQVEITFDAKGIPQVWAENENDAFYAMGWLHASDRLWQMDLSRRVAQGRLSEILGKSTLALDKEQRRVGHKRLAQKQLQRLDPQNRQRLKAYAAGINDYVRQCDTMPFEFYLLGYDFEPWTVLDCLTLFSFQTWFSDALMNSDKLYAKLAEKLGPEEARKLLYDYPSSAPLTVPPADSSSSFRQKIAAAFLKPGIVPLQMCFASNSWVVSPSKSVSGSAMLASDPHLDITRLPQFWYLLGLHVKDSLNVLGISTPGVPFIVMGHNGQIAFAFTAGGIDETAYYSEQINPQDSLQYRVQDSWQKFDVIKDTIKIAGEKSLPIKILSTRHGPVMFKTDSLHLCYACDWIGFDTDLDRSISAGFGLAKAGDFETFRQCVTQMGALNANWTYADAKGNIGYQLGTPVARETFTQSHLPANGWETGSIWQGYVPVSNLPSSYNPSRGWLATANNKQDDPSDYSINGSFYSNRIKRISKLLSGKQIFSLADFENMQADRTDEELLEWRDIIVGQVQDQDSLLDTDLKLLKSWDGFTSKESHETAFIMLFIEELKKNVFEDDFGKDWKKVSAGSLLQMQSDTTAQWYDDIRTKDQRESRREIFLKSFKSVMGQTRGKTWADFQTFKMAHPFSVIPVLSSLLDLQQGPFPWPGTNGTIDASFSVYNDQSNHFDVIVGPSWRFLIDFADIDAAQMVLPAGNSGNPMSSHFMDFFELWRKGNYWTVPFSKEKVFQKAVDTMMLLPQQ